MIAVPTRGLSTALRVLPVLLIVILSTPAWICWPFLSAARQTTVLNMVSPAASARAMGMALGCIFLGQFLHPFVMKPLTDLFGLHGAVMWLGIASAAAALIAMVWRF